MKQNYIHNQVFIGCPWKTVRKKYETLIEEFKKRYPLSFVIVGRGTDQKAEDLLKIIKDKLFSSSGAIFDASGGNANVSLEYGLAEALELPRCIYITQHKRAKVSGSDSAIISDLAGKKRNNYKQIGSLRSLLTSYTQGHSYLKQFERFLKDTCGRMKKGEKRSFRSLALKIIHCLDEKDSIRRSDVVQDLIGQGYADAEVEDAIRRLRSSKLIKCSEGRFSYVTIG